MVTLRFHSPYLYACSISGSYSYSCTLFLTLLPVSGSFSVFSTSDKKYESRESNLGAGALCEISFSCVGVYICTYQDTLLSGHSIRTHSIYIRTPSIRTSFYQDILYQDTLYQDTLYQDTLYQDILLSGHPLSGHTLSGHTLSGHPSIRTLSSVPNATFVYLTISEMRTPLYSGHFNLPNGVLIKGVVLLLHRIIGYSRLILIIFHVS